MASMYLTIFDQREQTSQEPLARDAASLYRAFEQVKDGRGKKGKRYPLAFLLTLLMLGKMAGETKIEGIVDWIDERRGEIKKVLNWPKGFPSESTYTYALTKCDHHEIAKVLAQCIVKARAVEQCDNEPSRLIAQKEQKSDTMIHTAVDGKVLRGTLKHGRGRTALSGERKGGSLKNDAFGDILSVCKQKQKSWTRPFNFAPTRRVLQVA